MRSTAYSGGGNVLLEFDAGFDADKAMDDAATMLKVKRGWLKFGEEDPWWVVHPFSEPTLSRYNSDSLLEVKNGTLEEPACGGCCWCIAGKTPGTEPVEQQEHDGGKGMAWWTLVSPED